MELTPGANAPAPAGPWTITVTAAGPVDVVALVTGADRRVRGDDDVVFFNAPVGRGVSWQEATPQLTVDPALLDPAAAAVVVTVCADTRFTGVPAVRLQGSDSGTVDVPLVGLAALTGVVALELYRRAGVWKVRAVVQGWGGGLAAILVAHGVDVDGAPAAPAAAPLPGPPSAPAAPEPPTRPSRANRGLTPAAPAAPEPPTRPSRANRGLTPAAPAAPPVSPGAEPVRPLPVPGPTPAAQGPPASPRRVPPATPDYRNVLRAIFEESSRAVIAYRDTTSFALSRRERQTSELMRTQQSGTDAYRAARAELQKASDDLMTEGTRRLDLAVSQVTEELLAMQPPAPAAPWGNPVWDAWVPPDDVEPAILVGRLGVPENEGLLLPLTVTPFGGPVVWHAVDPDVDASQLAAAAHAHVVRLIAAVAPLGPRVAVLDPAGRGFPSLGPRAQMVVADTEVRALLAEASRVVALGDAPDRPIVLVVVGHPEGLDELQALQLSTVLRDGARVGILVVMTASLTEDPSMSAGALVARQESLHLPLGSTATVTDVWVSTEWSFTAEGAPPAHVLTRVLAEVSEP